MTESCLGNQAYERGCVYELDSLWQTGDCQECKFFGCNEDNCDGCKKDCDYRIEAIEITAAMAGTAH